MRRMSSPVTTFTAAGVEESGSGFVETVVTSTLNSSSMLIFFSVPRDSTPSGRDSAMAAGGSEQRNSAATRGTADRPTSM